MSKQDLPATAPQKRKLLHLCWALKHPTFEDKQMTRGEAGRTIRTMLAELHSKDKQ